jgi:serine/threonine-protein kinase
MSARLGVTLLALVFFAPLARAQEDVAERAYSEGLTLFNEGKMTAACEKFEESRRAEEGIGVTLYLGACYKKIGRTASAWERYREAEALARARDDARAGVAHAEAEELAPLLARIDVRVPTPWPQGLEVLLDGAVLPPGAWTGTPVDPGTHLVVARAPGVRARELKVDVVAGPGTTRADVGVLGAGTKETPAPAPDSSSRRIVALAVGGAGIVTLALGAAFGLAAIHKVNASNDSGDCVADRCNAEGARLREDARSPAAASTGFFVLGTATLAAGVYLFLTATRHPAKAARPLGF